MIEDIGIDEDLTSLGDGYHLIQKKSGFRFSVDPVILADFFKEQKSGKVLDIGTGNGIIPILLLKKKGNWDITGIEIQEETAKLAERNLILNHLEENVRILVGDVKELKEGNSFDYIISNPPYMELDGKKQNLDEAKLISRHEVKLTLEELVENAKRLLKPRGKFFLVHRSHRFLDIAKAMEKNGFSLQRVKFVYYSEGRDANLVLVEAQKGKKCKFIVEEPLFLEKYNGV